MPVLVSAHQAAARCGVSERTVRRWIVAGRLSADKQGGSFRVALEDVRALAAARRGHDADAAAAPDSAAAPNTEGATSGTDAAAAGPDMPRRPSDAPASLELVQLVARLHDDVGRAQADTLRYAEAAAAWQARAELLAAQLEQAREQVRALQAPAPPEAPEHDVAGQQAANPAQRVQDRGPVLWWRRWWPAFPAIALAVVVVLVIVAGLAPAWVR